jgi:hypothetical protein
MALNTALRTGRALGEAPSLPYMRAEPGDNMA